MSAYAPTTSPCRSGPIFVSPVIHHQRTAAGTRLQHSGESKCCKCFFAEESHARLFRRRKEREHLRANCDRIHHRQNRKSHTCHGGGQRFIGAEIGECWRSTPATDFIGRGETMDIPALSSQRSAGGYRYFRGSAV